MNKNTTEEMNKKLQQQNIISGIALLVNVLESVELDDSDRDAIIKIMQKNLTQWPYIEQIETTGNKNSMQAMADMINKEIKSLLTGLHLPLEANYFIRSDALKDLFYKKISGHPKHVIKLLSKIGLLPDFDMNIAIYPFNLCHIKRRRGVLYRRNNGTITVIGLNQCNRIGVIN